MADLPPPEHITVSPEPTSVEMAAILAVFSDLWPAPVQDEAKVVPTRWRFSGRWWANDSGRRVPGRPWS
jgi:hypothetical protein